MANCYFATATNYIDFNETALTTISDGRLLAVIRSRTQGETWNSEFSINRYTGSKYDGGYGNLVQAGMDTVVSIYYTCDNQRQPWIGSSLIKIDSSP